ncbi:MAG: hypothetical protein OEY36_07610 [Gammaproteobacteria bacterium]|nr:hypothetical protein [Gammaproteobacteria bacterium]
MSTLWLNDWENTDISQLQRLFGITDSKLDGVELILASHHNEDDSGYAFILYCSRHILYEINASHDSELNLIGQWQPEETTLEALLFRLTRGNLGKNQQGDDIFASALLAVLKRYMQ